MQNQNEELKETKKRQRAAELVRVKCDFMTVNDSSHHTQTFDLLII